MHTKRSLQARQLMIVKERKDNDVKMMSASVKCDVKIRAKKLSNMKMK